LRGAFAVHSLSDATNAERSAGRLISTVAELASMGQSNALEIQIE
jgi:hypothetical protein